VNAGLIALALTACYAVGLVGWRFYRYAGPELVVRDGMVMEERPTKVGALQRFSDWCADRFAADVLRRLGPERVDAIRRRLESAGRPNGMTLEAYAGRKVALASIFGLLGAVMAMQGRWLIGLGLVAFGWYITDLGLKQEAKKRQQQIERDLPDFLDILSVSVRAGLSFRSGIARVAEALPGPLAEEMWIALRKMGLGESRRAALEDLRDRNDSEVLGQFVGSLLQAEDLGTPLADTLGQIALEMRRDAAARARQRAARAAPRVSLIVTLVILPAAMMVMVTGLLVSTEFNLDMFSG
jgi:tight adherence protein C